MQFGITVPLAGDFDLRWGAGRRTWWVGEMPAAGRAFSMDIVSSHILNTVNNKFSYLLTIIVFNTMYIKYDYIFRLYIF